MNKLKIYLATIAVIILGFIAFIFFERRDIGKYQLSGEGDVLNTITGELSIRAQDENRNQFLKKVNMNTGVVTEIKYK